MDTNELRSTANIIKSAIAKLQNVTDEATIRGITIDCWTDLEEIVPNELSFRAIRKDLRSAIEKAFPASQESKPGYYFTTAGKGKDGRYEHLALWYATTSKKKWDIIGDAARKEYFDNLPPLPSKEQPEQQPEQQPKQQVEQPKPQTKRQPKQQKPLEIEDMTIEGLKLDIETKQIVADAIAQSGMSLAEFVQQACKVYAKTITGKSRKQSEDLSAVSTEDLRNGYRTHPGRAEELVKRAVQYIKEYNGQCTELSQKWLITQSLLVDMTGAKASTTGSIIEKYKTDIESYNQTLLDAGANSLLNRKDKELKADFCEEWVRRFQSNL